jgi:hypothetical protein
MGKTILAYSNQAGLIPRSEERINSNDREKPGGDGAGADETECGCGFHDDWIFLEVTQG